MHKKITTGFVIQTFETIDGKHICVDQEFVAGDQVDYEDGEGNPVEVNVDLEQYFPLAMKKTNQKIRLDDDLVFTCSSCGKHRLECCEDGAYSSEVICMDEEGDFDYGEIDASGIVVRFQCLDCGEILTNKEEGFAEYDITNTEEVAEWIKKNCEQPEEYVGHRGIDDNADK